MCTKFFIVQIVRFPHRKGVLGMPPKSLYSISMIARVCRGCRLSAFTINDICHHRCDEEENEKSFPYTVHRSSPRTSAFPETAPRSSPRRSAAHNSPTNLLQEDLSADFLLQIFLEKHQFVHVVLDCGLIRHYLLVYFVRRHCL